MDLLTQLQEHLGSAYRIDRELGGGGMSRVFVAHELRLARNIVIKVLSPELVAGLSAERFEREILLAASLQQANIVPVLGAGEVAGLPYFTMPFVEGESLRSRIDGNGLPVAEVLAILRDVTRALAYAHARGIVHRDIKPDNVLLSGGTAVVTDFGIAKALAASQQADGERPTTLTSIGTSIGTPAYMAPEQVAGDPGVDHRADLYSLGCMTFELLTGRAPFADRPPQRMLTAHLSEAPIAVSALRVDCPPALAALVERLMAKDPADRPNDADAVLQWVQRVATGRIDAPASRISLPKALAVLAGATIVVGSLAWLAVTQIGLPDWTFGGAVFVMLLGVPMMLLTAWRARADQPLSWRGTIRGGVIAMGAFVVLVAGFMVTRALGIGPAASLLAEGKLAAEDRIVLAEITAPDDAGLAPIVTEAIRAAMSQSRAVRLLEPGDVAELLGEMRQPNITRVEGDIARELAARSGASAILGGRLARAGRGYAMSIELVSVAGGTVLASVQGTAAQAGDLIQTVDDLTRRLRGKIGESLRQVQRSVPLERATTTSLEALRHYSEASRLNDVERDYDGAVVEARQAVALDSTFALAWRKLAIALMGGRGALASRDSALEMSVKFADKLPPLERHLVMGTYFTYHSQRNDAASAAAAFRAAYAADSTNLLSISVLRVHFTANDQPDSALYFGRRAYQLRPNLSNRINVVVLLRRAGDIPGAKLLLDSIAAANPADTAAATYLRAAWMLALESGDPERSEEYLRQLSRAPLITDRIDALYNLASLEQSHGRLAASQALTVQQANLLAARDRFFDAPLWEADKNIRFRGRTALGVRQLDELVAGPGWTGVPVAERPYWDVIDIYCEAGRPDRARAIMAAWLRDDPDVGRSAWFATYLWAAQGAIAAAEGDYPLAATRYRAALTNTDGSPAPYQGLSLLGLGRAYDRGGQVDSAMAVYQRFLALPPYDRQDGVAEGNGLALVYRRLGDMHLSRGERGKAVASYQSFVDLWKDADPELQPAVTSVRAQLTELQRTEGN